MKLQSPSGLARLIKNARAQRDEAQQEVADAVGITRQSLARVERGHGGTSFNTVLLILDHLGIRLEAEVEHRTQNPAMVATTNSAQVAAAALAKRLDPLISSGALKAFSTQILTVPGSVVQDAPRAVEKGMGATATPEPDAESDAAGGAG